MKHHISALFIILFMLSSSIQALAQSNKEVEEASFILCQEMSGTATEAEACTDWIASSIVTATYRSRLPEIAKYLSNSNILKYQINADKKLAFGKCETMTAFELNFDILESLPKGSERDNRAKGLRNGAQNLLRNNFCMQHQTWLF